MENETNVFDAVERRAWVARRTMGEVCAEAKVALPVWSRAKKRGTISVTVLRKMEQAVARLEVESL